MNVEQIQTMVNTYISTNLGKIKQSMSKEYYNSVPKEYINLIKEINVEIKNDKFQKTIINKQNKNGKETEKIKSKCK